MLNYAQHIRTCCIHPCPHTNTTPAGLQKIYVGCIAAYIKHRIPSTWMNDWISNHNKNGECSLWGLYTLYFGYRFLRVWECVCVRCFSSVLVYSLPFFIQYTTTPTITTKLHPQALVCCCCFIMYKDRATWIILIVFGTVPTNFTLYRKRLIFLFGLVRTFLSLFLHFNFLFLVFFVLYIYDMKFILIRMRLIYSSLRRDVKTTFHIGSFWFNLALYKRMTSDAKKMNTNIKWKYPINSKKNKKLHK